MFGLIKPLFSLGFWFSFYPMPFSPWSQWLVIGTGFIFFFGGVYLYLKRKQEKDKDVKLALRRAGTCAMWAGVTAFLLWFFVWEQVAILSMRIFWVVWLIGYGYWAYTIWLYWKQDLPAKRALAAEKALQEKWLPKSRK